MLKQIMFRQSREEEDEEKEEPAVFKNNPIPLVNKINHGSKGAVVKL